MGMLVVPCEVATELMARFTVDPGEFTGKGIFGFGGTGASSLAVCVGCCSGVWLAPCCGAGCCCGVASACCWAGAGGGVFGFPGLRASSNLRKASLLGTGVRVCAMRFASDMRSVLGGV